MAEEVPSTTGRRPTLMRRILTIGVAAFLVLIAIGVVSQSPGWLFGRVRTVRVTNIGTTALTVHYQQSQSNTYHTTISDEKTLEPGKSTRFRYIRGDRIVVHDGGSNNSSIVMLDGEFRSTEVRPRGASRDWMARIERIK